MSFSQFPTTSCYNMTFKAPCCYVFGVVLSELTTVSADSTSLGNICDILADIYSIELSNLSEFLNNT